MKNPSVVGLTLNYRDAARTCECVKSLLDDGVEHVLVWDNSEDKGASVSHLRALIQREPSVSILISTQNLGFAAGVNRGLEWIRSRFPDTWILLINNDAILLSGGINALSSALAKTSKAVIAYPIIDHGGHPIGTAYYQRHFGLYTSKRLPGCIPYSSGCCQMLAPERLSGTWFDEDFFMYGEDVELGSRLGEQRMIHVPWVYVLHKGSASSGIGTSFYEGRMVAAHWMLARKLAKNRLDFSLLWLGRMVALPARALLRAWRHRSLTPIKSLLVPK